MGKRFRRSACASVIGMQTRAAAELRHEIEFFSAVTNSAAKMRSPSFSRSSSSDEHGHAAGFQLSDDVLNRIEGS